MPNLTAGQSATIDIPAGMPCYVSTTQDAYVDLVAGAPGSGYTSDRLVGGRAGKLYGPWTTPAKITIRSALGTATYGGAYAADPIDLGQKSAAAIVAINAAIAAGTASYPAASTVVNTDTGARWTLSGLGTAAAFAVDGAGNSVLVAANVIITSANAAAYNGKQLQFAAAYTITLSPELPTDFGFTALPPASGNASIAFTGGANGTTGSTATVTRSLANNVAFAVIKDERVANRFAVTGS